MSLNELSAAFADTIEKNNPFVFNITGDHMRRSAVAVDGFIVTAAHGLDNGGTVDISTHDGKAIEVEFAGLDRRLDLAFFKPGEELPAPPVSNGAGLRVGNLVFALGRPGKSLRAALGMISVFAPEFRGPTGVKLTPFIEVDGSLPRGFSGGALISHDGEMIGMNTSVPRGSGMTVPVDNIRRSIERLGKGEKVRIGYLGVNTASATLAGGDTALVVTGVDPESPAATAKLATGDIIVSMDGEAMASQAALYHVLLDGPRKIQVTFERGGIRKDLHVELSERPSD
jgi:S1-C subfamily serine protease